MNLSCVNLLCASTAISALPKATSLDNLIFPYANTSCYTQSYSFTGNNWIQFHANNFITDFQILSTAGTSGTSNTGNLIFLLYLFIF